MAEIIPFPAARQAHAPVADPQPAAGSRMPPWQDFAIVAFGLLVLALAERFVL